MAEYFDSLEEKKSVDNICEATKNDRGFKKKRKKKKKLKKKSRVIFKFLFVDSVGAVRACLFSQTTRTYHSGP